MKKLEDMRNKTVEAYPCLLSVCDTSKQWGDKIEKRKFKNRKHKERKKRLTRNSLTARKPESNKNYIKNFSNSEMTADQVKYPLPGIKVRSYANNK